MTDVQGPDGIVRFPDDMAMSDIQAAMQKNYPIQPAPAAAAPAPQPPTDNSYGVLPALKGASRAIEAGLPFGDRAVAAARSLAGQGTYAQDLPQEQQTNEQFRQQNPGTALLGNVTASLPALAVPGGVAGGLGQRLVTGALSGAGTGALYGASQSPDLTNQSATLPPAALGAALGAGTGAAVPLISKAVSPFIASPATRNAVDLLQSENIPLTAGQQTGSQGLQNVESAGLGARGFAQDQAQKLTQAELGRAGLPRTSVAGGDIVNMQGANSRQLTDLGASNTLVHDPESIQAINDAAGGYDKLIQPGQEVQKVADRLTAERTMAGERYQNWRSELTNKAYDAAKAGDSASASAYGGMRDALDAGMERSIAANNPSDIGAFPEARRAYGNLQSIEKAAARTTGDKSVEGVLDPNKLQTVLRSGREGDYLAGKGDLDELTRAAAGIIRPAEQPGNPLLNYAARHAIASALGGAGGYYTEGGPGAVIGAVAGPKVIGTLARAPGIKNYLANQLMNRIPSPGNVSALAAALANRNQ